MESLLVFLLVQLSVSSGRPYDPAPGIWHGKAEARNLDCARMSREQAHELHPGEIPAPLARLAQLRGTLLVGASCLRFPRIGTRFNI